MLLVRRRFKDRVQLQITPWSQFFDWVMSADAQEYEEWRQYSLDFGMVDYSTEYV